MKRAFTGRHYPRRPRRPTRFAPPDERILKRDALLPTALPHVERLVRATKTRGFLSVSEFHPMEGDILTAVVCRYCRAPFPPYARLLQRNHVAGHQASGRRPTA